jgi:hypothetical protein
MRTCARLDKGWYMWVVVSAAAEREGESMYIYIYVDIRGDVG